MRTRKNWSLVAAVAAVLALVGVGLVLAGGGSSGGGVGPDLAQAADSTARVTSGAATSVITPEGGGPTTKVSIRFDGADAEASFDGRAVRVVDGKGYERTGDGPWTPIEGDEPTNVTSVMRNDITDTTLLDAVRTAPDATRDGDVYRATVSAEAASSIDNGLLGLGGAPLAEDVTVEVETGPDDLLRKVTVAGSGATRTVTYSGLNEPQGLTAP